MEINYLPEDLQRKLANEGWKVDCSQVDLGEAIYSCSYEHNNTRVFSMIPITNKDIETTTEALYLLARIIENRTVQDVKSTDCDVPEEVLEVKWQEVQANLNLATVLKKYILASENEKELRQYLGKKARQDVVDECTKKLKAEHEEELYAETKAKLLEEKSHVTRAEVRDTIDKILKEICEEYICKIEQTNEYKKNLEHMIDAEINLLQLEVNTKGKTQYA